MKVLSSNKTSKIEFCFQFFLILLVCFIYSYSWKFEIFDDWDDHVYILNNRYLSMSWSNILYWFTHDCVGVYLPITMLSYMVDYSIWGFNSFGYHLQNIFWHIVTVLAVYNCFRLFKIKSWIVFFLCLIFAVHPQRVETVVWLSERKDVLCAAFYFLSIYFYIRNKNKRFSIIAYLFFILSILSKPMAVSLPIVLLLYEFYRGSVISKQSTVSSEKKLEVCNQPCRGEAESEDWLAVTSNPITNNHQREFGTQHSAFNIQHYRKLWPYFLILIIFIPISYSTQFSDGFNSTPISSLSKIYTVVFNIYWYFKETLFSTDLNPMYPTITLFYSFIDVIVFYTACFVLALILFCKKHDLFIYGIIPLVLCYLVSLFPVIGLVKLGSIDHADRYSYIPSVFIWFSFGIILTQLLYKEYLTNNKLIHSLRASLLLNKKFIVAVLVLYSAVMIFNNIKYQSVWENKFKLFNYSVKNNPVNYVAIMYLIEMEYNIRNNYNVVVLANRLRSIADFDLMSEFYISLVKYRYNKKEMMKSLVGIEPKLRKNVQSEIIHERYVILLGLIIEGYESMGNKHKILEYINKILALPKITDFTNFYYHGLKTFYLKHYEKSLYWFKRALIIQPKNKNIKKIIYVCNEHLNSL